jgi:hypothetical protein
MDKVFVKRFGHSYQQWQEADHFRDEMEYSTDPDHEYWVVEWGKEFPDDEPHDGEPVRRVAVVNEAGYTLLKAEAEAEGWREPNDADI